MDMFTLILDRMERVIKSDSTFVSGVFGRRNTFFLWPFTSASRGSAIHVFVVDIHE